MTPPLEERLAKIDVLVLDVDGVLTDGRVIYSDNGAEVQAFDVRDGTGLSLWRRSGKRAAVISGRGSDALRRRAEELGLNPVIQKASDKATAFVELLAKLDVEPSRVIAIGDDLPDLPVLRRAGVGVAVADACPELREVADLVTDSPGGRGAVREIIERVLKAQGHWQNLVASFA